MLAWARPAGPTQREPPSGTGRRHSLMNLAVRGRWPALSRPSIVCVLFVRLLLAPPVHAAIVAGSASDICPLATDPCVISSVVQVLPNAVLDFGTRGVSVVAGGQLDFGSSSATLRCGQFDVAVATAATGIVVRGKIDGEFQGGVVRIEARRACSGNPGLSCMADSICQAQSAGACSALSTGTMTIGGKVAGNAVEPGGLVLYAAGDIRIDQPLNFNGTTADSDGGAVEIESYGGDVVVNRKIDATAGKFSTGGDVSIAAAVDVRINDFVDVSGGGGDADGGTVLITADRDVLITADVLANAGASFGGDVVVAAGRDLLLAGGTSTAAQRVAASASTNADGDTGDGGEIDLSAGRNLELGPFVKVEANGSAPDGDGALLVALDAGAQLSLRGVVEAKAKGSQGRGGEIWIQSAGDADVSTSARIDASGGAGGGGIVDLGASHDLLLSGVLDVSASGGGQGGLTTITAGAALTLIGSVAASGSAVAGINGLIELEGCYTSVSAGGSLVAGGGYGVNRMVARGEASLEAGAQMMATGGAGRNEILYRNQVPTVSGIADPAVTLVATPSLPSCGVADSCVPGQPCDDGDPCTGGDICGDGVCKGSIELCGTCGNAEVELGEVCDRGVGNGLQGGSCSLDCAFVGCGDPNDSHSHTASDALYVLRAAVGAATCEPCVCDAVSPNAQAGITASDALAVLRKAVGISVPLSCPACTP